MKLVNDGNKHALILTNDEIDKMTFAQIRNKYPEGEEFKLLRLTLEALVNGDNPPQEFLEYLTFIKECINKGEKLKIEQRMPK